MKTSRRQRGTILIRVGPHHFAFLRGYLEGLDLAALARRYLETAATPDPELRAAKATLKWIREQLMVAARRRGHFPDARLILIDPDKLRQAGAGTIPSLEEFREQRDPHELYSEAELIELFHEEFGGNAHTDRRVQRNERLRRRQQQVLAELEKLLGAPPAPQDDVAGWLDARLAKRLKGAGLHTLRDLVDTINGRGYRWWIRVPRIGEKAAAQVVAWLKTESVAGALSVPLGIQASVRAGQLPMATLAARRPKHASIVPLEHLALPPELDGSAGSNRGAACRIAANNDPDAIREWLATKPAQSSTWRSYRKEAERFLLWATLERQRPLSSLSRDDCSAYCDFLARLGDAEDAPWTYRIPRRQWFAARGTKRWSALWRPFEGPLSAQSRQLAVTVLRLMSQWLAETGYWAHDVWAELAPAAATSGGAQRRGFAEGEWELLWNYLESTPRDAKYERLRFVLLLARVTGLRLSELANARVGHIRYVKGAAQPGWELDIGGSAKFARTVPLPAELLQALNRYLAHRGLADYRGCDPSTCLISRLPCDNPRPVSAIPGKPDVSASALYQITKRFFQDAAAAIGAEEARVPDGTVQRLRSASPDWLRH